MSERVPGVEDIRQALRGDGWTLDEADEGIDRIKQRGIGIGHEMARETMQASIGDAFREAKAEAWDEGYDSRKRQAAQNPPMGVPGHVASKNPYRTEGLDSEGKS